jgi:hypothetical protein
MSTDGRSSSHWHLDSCFHFMSVQRTKTASCTVSLGYAAWENRLKSDIDIYADFCSSEETWWEGLEAMCCREMQRMLLPVRAPTPFSRHQKLTNSSPETSYALLHHFVDEHSCWEVRFWSWLRHGALIWASFRSYFETDMSWRWRLSSGVLHRVALVRPDVSENIPPPSSEWYDSTLVLRRNHCWVTSP